VNHAVQINHRIAVWRQRAAQSNIRIKHAILVKIHHAQKVSAADLPAGGLHLSAQQSQ